MGVVTSPLMTDETGQAILTKLDAIRNALNPNAQGVSFDKTGCGIITTNNVQDAVKQLDSGLVNTNSSLAQKLEVATLSTQLTIDYADSSTIGYRTTELTKVNITTLPGYPTGKTITAVVAKCTDYRGAEVFVNENNDLRGVMKVSATVDVTIYVFYK